MIEARTVAFILIILLIAFIIYRLCLSNERKTKGGFCNLNDVVISVFDSIESNSEPEDIDIAAVKSEVLKTLDLVSERSRETLKSAFYNKLNGEQRIAFIEALIHSLYVEGYAPSEFKECDFYEKRVILKARHNYKYSYIAIYLNNLDNEINDMSKYLNTINNEDNKYKISICNSIKAHSVSRLGRWGVYEYDEKDNRKIDIDYKEGYDDLLRIQIVRATDNVENITIPDDSIQDLFGNSKDITNISNNSGMLTDEQPRVVESSITQIGPISTDKNNGSVRVDKSNSIYDISDKKNSQISNITPTMQSINNETNLGSLDDSNRVDESNSNHNSKQNNTDNNIDDLLDIANKMSEENKANLLNMANM